jgi:hypothetical protein
MAKYFLAGFLIIFGLSGLLGVNIPMWLTDLLAVGAGFLILVDK